MIDIDRDKEGSKIENLHAKGSRQSLASFRRRMGIDAIDFPELFKLFFMRTISRLANQIF